MGAEPVRMDAELHDRVLGAGSHLPHVAAYALAATLGAISGDVIEGLRRLPTPSLRDTTRVAASSPVMWRDIFLDNRAEVLPLIEALVQQVEALRARHRRRRREADRAAARGREDRTRPARAGLAPSRELDASSRPRLVCGCVWSRQRSRPCWRRAAPISCSSSRPRRPRRSRSPQRPRRQRSLEPGAGQRRRAGGGRPRCAARLALVALADRERPLRPARGGAAPLRLRHLRRERAPAGGHDGSRRRAAHADHRARDVRPRARRGGVHRRDARRDRDALA